ncbi:MAG: O-antigen ligase family protein, partial [Synergistaceae bacterium]|nr:O-antigen ligase family protein [Synergistaceae bacterium]
MKRIENITSSKIIDKNTPLPLVPSWILLPLWCISLALPNLIYSGLNFADTLHIIKWTVAGVPVAIALFVAGVRLAIYGPERIKLKLDIFAIIWAIILVYCAAMPLWIDINSPTGFVLEMTCFATVWVFYVITVSSYPDWGVKPVIILGIVNASINIFFAELQSRNMNDLTFLRGTIFEDLISWSSLILPTPGNYIGNTAQQNMFGLWIAISVLGAIYLYVFDVWKKEEASCEVSQKFKAEVWLPVLSLCVAVVNMKFYFANEIKIAGFLAIIFVLLAFVSIYKLGNKKHLYYSLVILFFAGWCSWGLIESTSRSAILALITGLVMMFIISALKFNKRYLIRFAAIMLLVLTVISVALSSGDKAAAILKKTQDIIENYEAIGQRRGIWATSFAMFHKYPMGVGIGQYKWHYLDGQREAFKLFPDADWMKWQYTHWAHNEFLQFFCEAGTIGGILFLVMYSLGFFPAVVGIKRK